MMTASIMGTAMMPTYAQTIESANGATVVLDGYVSIDSDVYGSSDSQFAAVTSTPEKIEKLITFDDNSRSSVPFSQYGINEWTEVTKVGLHTSSKNTTTTDDGEKTYYFWIYGAKEEDAPSFVNTGICNSARIYAIAVESDSDDSKIDKNDMRSPDAEYAAKLVGMKQSANSKNTVMVNTHFSHPGTSFSYGIVYDYNVHGDTNVFPDSYPGISYALPEDLQQLCPWYMSYRHAYQQSKWVYEYDENGKKKTDENGNYIYYKKTWTEYRWSGLNSYNDRDLAESIAMQYCGTKYLNMDDVNGIWTELSGEDEDEFQFMKRNIKAKWTTYTNRYGDVYTYFSHNMDQSFSYYNWLRKATLYDYYATRLPISARTTYYHESKPSYKEYGAEIKWENVLTSDWQVSADEKTWYTIATGITGKDVSYHMLSQQFKIGGTAYDMPDAIKGSEIWYVRRISTAAGIYGTTISPSVKFHPFITLDGIDLWATKDIVEGTYLSPNDIMLNVHYSTGDKLMSGNGSYISYPGNANLRIKSVGDNWVYYVFNDPITKDTLKGFFKVKGIQKTPLSATATYVGGTVTEQTEYKPEYLRVNVTFNNGTIDTFTGSSSSVGTYKYKFYGRGDLDGNGVLNDTDASLLTNIIRGGTASSTQKVQADVNQDGQINDDDLTKLKEYISKKVTKIGNNEFYAAYSGVKLTDGSPKYARFTVEGVKKKPYKLTVVSDPLKLRYIEGDDFKPSGMTLCVLYDNGESKYISYGENDTYMEGVQLGDDDNPATNMKANTALLPIYYSEDGIVLKTELKLTITLSSLTSIKVTRAPDTTVYYAGESFKTTGMNVTAYFDEGVEDHTPDEKELSASEYILSNYKALKDSTEYVVLKLDDPSKVQKASGEYIRISKNQLVNQDFTDGLYGTFTYKNGTTVSGTVCGNHLVKISYTYRGVTKVTYQPIYAMQKKPTSLSIISMPYKVDYTAGENFVQDGMILRVTYSDGSSNYVYAKTDYQNGYTIAEGEKLKVSQNYVIAEYTENNTTLQLEIPIMVTDPTIDGITATYLGTNVYVGQDFKRKDVQIVVSYTNGTIKSFRANEVGQTVRFVKPSAADGSVNINSTETLTVTDKGDNVFAAVYAGMYDTFSVPGVGNPDMMDFSGSIAKTKRMYDTWTEKFTAIKIKSVADYINGRVEDSIADHEVNAQKTTDTRQYLTEEEGTGQGVIKGNGTTSALLSFLREGTWRQPETVISLKYKGRTRGYLYPETTNPKFTAEKESDLKYIEAHEQSYTTSREELQSYMEEGWSDWVTNGDSVGTSLADRIAYRYTGTGDNPDPETMLLEALKIKLDNVPAGSDPKLNVSVKDKSGKITNYNGIKETDTISEPAQIKIELAGTVRVTDNYGNEVVKPFGDVYKIYYRASADDSVQWSKGGEWAGFDGVQIQCLEIRLMLIESDFDIGSMTEAPVINTQPKNISAKIGNNATLAVSAIGNDLVYQWYKNGKAVADATTAVYATPELTLDNDGDVWYCIVTSNGGSGISSKTDSITITVRDQAPILTKDLEDTITCSVGDEVSMSIDATSLNPAGLKYEWQITKNGTYVSLAGGTENSIKFTVTPDMHGQYVRCHVTNATGSCNSNPCLIQCVDAPVVTINSSEASAFVNVSKAKVITFSTNVVSNASGEKTYVWVVDGITKGTTTDSITWIPSDTGTHNISCTVTDSLGKSGTGSYTVYVGNKPTVKLAATKSKQSDGTWTVVVKATITSSDSANLTYKWGVDGSVITSNTSNATISSDKKTLTLTGLTAGTQKSISLEVSDHYGTVNTLAGTVAN